MEMREEAQAAKQAEEQVQTAAAAGETQNAEGCACAKETQATAADVEADVASEVAAEADDCTAKITEELEAAKKALADAQEECLRARAEVQNMRRRCEQDVDKAKKYAIDRFAKELIPVIEPLEKAIQFADRENEASKNMLVGVEQTYNLLMKALKNNQLEEVNPEGAEFDPNLHQAIQSLENPNVPANHVMAVVQKGYVLNGRVIRPAMVIVSKGAGNTVDSNAQIFTGLKIPKSERMATGALVKAHRVKAGLLYRFKLLLIKWFQRQTKIFKKN